MSKELMLILVIMTLAGIQGQWISDKEHEKEITALVWNRNVLSNKYKERQIQVYDYVWPVVEEDYKEISSYYGYRSDPMKANTGGDVLREHPALDLTGVPGARLVSIGDGIVINKWYPEGYHNGIYYKGNEYFNGYVQIQLDDGKVASYGHVSDIIVHEGDRVDMSQELCRINSEVDEHSTGRHVHFSLQDEFGNFLQPLKFVEEAE
jgi:murein DD-endopeptidase MepM/ murein hydrolase activator NlpD